MVFLPFPGAVKDEVSGNYFTDANMLTMISEVVVKDDKIYAVDTNGKVLLSPEDNITQIPYTQDLTAQKDTLGNIYTLTGGQALPVVPVITGSGEAAVLAQNEDGPTVAGATATAATNAASTVAAPKTVSPNSIVLVGQWV